MRRTFPIWVFPTMFLAIGFACGLALSRIELGPDAGLSFLAYGGDAEAARSLLSNVIGGIVSITTLTLTITIVTIQLASSQYSPRLMKRYLRDRSLQLTMSYFFFVFAFAIPVLFHVRSGDTDEERYVPDVALSLVIVLAVLMLGGLVFFVYRVTRSVRVENILEDIAEAAIRVLENGPKLGEGDDPPAVSNDATVVLARRSGFLNRVDVTHLDEHLGAGERIWFEVGVGDYVIAGAPVAWYRGEVDAEHLAALVDEALTLGSERDEHREFAFGLRQIVDIGVKALSPGINDPTTAIVSVNVATRALARAASSTSVERSDRADGGVVLPRPSWSGLVFVTFDQFITYGSGDAQVIRAIARSAKQIVALAPPEADTERIGDMLDSVDAHVSASNVLESERAVIAAQLDDCRRLLAERPGFRPEHFRPTEGVM